VLKYSLLKQYLMSLDFDDISVKSTYYAFKHIESGTLIVLSLLAGDDDVVRQEDLVSVRRHLVENGLITGREFASFLKTSARSVSNDSEQ
jgi:hypothetical protein